MPGHDPLHKVTIIPRGRALGITFYLPDGDRHSHTKEWYTSRIASAFGGRIAEELIYGPTMITDGASSDIQQATTMARTMVTRLGFSDRLGPLAYAEEEGEVFLGRTITQHKNVSDDTARTIDEEIRRLIDDCYGKARQLLQDNLDKLHTMADALIKYETLDANQIQRIMRGEPPGEPDSGPTTPPPPVKGAGAAPTPPPVPKPGPSPAA